MSQVKEIFNCATGKMEVFELSAEEQAEFERIEAEHAAKAPDRELDKIREERAAAYGSIGDQLDRLYKDIISGKPLVQGDFVDNIETIKASLPK